MFERIVCGVDGSAASLEAVRQADVLLADAGRLVLVAAVDLTDAIHFQLAPTAVHAARRALEKAEELDRHALESLDRAQAEVVRAADVATQQASGAPARCLIDAAASERASLIAVGSHGRGHADVLALGGVVLRLLHRASCSLHVARAPVEGRWSPRRIVVGTDGSPQSEPAVAAALELGGRLGAEVEELTIEHRRPGHALVEAAAGVDLLVVGRRGSHGAHLLGSVSHHVARAARCSVLVVRDEQA
jgi:nucleotide-binding universal stress UspA family protein